MTDNGSKIKFSRRYLLLIVCFALAVYVIVPQFGDFQSSWHLLKNPDLGWTALALVLTVVTYFSAAATYSLLAFKPLRYFETVLVELAVMFVNRLLPGGVGALGGNYLYLTKKGHTGAQAGVMVAINNALGFIGHNILFFTVLIFAGSSAITNHNESSNLSWLKYVLVVLLAALIAFMAFGRRRFSRAIKDLRDQLFAYRRRLTNLVSAQLTSMTLTAANILALFACAQALGIDLGFAPIFLIFSLGLGAGTVTPTPGGLGGFEAGLTAGFIAYGVDQSPALATALLYRLISYWIPLFAGAAALVICQKKRLL